MLFGEKCSGGGVLGLGGEDVSCRYDQDILYKFIKYLGNK